MPGIRWCHWRWAISTDFIPVVAILGAIFHLVWCVQALSVGAYLFFPHAFMFPMVHGNLPGIYCGQAWVPSISLSDAIVFGDILRNVDLVPAAKLNLLVIY